MADRAEPMRIRGRYEPAEALATRHRRARRWERGEILDAFCLATGYERKQAPRGLRGRQPIPPKRRTPRTRRSGLEFRRVLRVAGRPPTTCVPSAFSRSARICCCSW